MDDIHNSYCAGNQSADSGVTELASIFLHDQHQDILLPNEPGASIYHMRGLGISPEKKGKGKPKFITVLLLHMLLRSPTDISIRIGLAARASNLFDQFHTSPILWQKELEKHPSISSLDLRMRIVKILHKLSLQGAAPCSPNRQHLHVVLHFLSCSQCNEYTQSR